MKQQNFDAMEVSLDMNEMLGFNQVAAVSADDASISLSDMGRVLSKKGEAASPVDDNDQE